MCHRFVCVKCWRSTWIGCGKHIDSALESVPVEKRCDCGGRARTQAEFDANGGGSFCSIS